MKITLVGIENYLNPEDSIINHMTMPDGIDKDTLLGSMILRCQEFELLYSDPDFFLSACDYWSRKHYRTFDKWIKALQLEYDPISNYDRIEETTTTHDGSFNKNGSNSNNTEGSQTGDNTRTNDLTRTDDLTQTNNLTGTDNTTTTGQITGYNSATFENKDKQVIDNDSTNTGTIKNTGSVKDSGTVKDESSNSYSNSETGSNSENGTDTYSDNIKSRIKGNIGVTTSQQMLQSELDIARFNIYEQIADLFCNEFCIMVY